MLADAVIAQDEDYKSVTPIMFLIIYILLLLNLVNKALTLMCCYQVLVVYAN